MGISIGLLKIPKFSTSSETSFKDSLNFCSLIALKWISIEIYSFGFNLPYLTITSNYWGSFSQPSSLNFIGIALVFWSFNYLLIVWFNNILVNFIGDPSFTSITGFDPKHLKGIVTGVGLFLIITISSSINGLGSSGIDQTLSYFGGSSGWITHLSKSTVKTPFLYPD